MSLQEGDKVSVAYITELDLTNMILKYLPTQTSDSIVLEDDEVRVLVLNSGICIVEDLKNE